MVCLPLPLSCADLHSDLPVSQDWNLTVYSDSPDLTPCFQNTVLAWLPCVYLWTALPCYLLYLKRHQQGYIVLSVLSRIKTGVGVLLWCVSWLDLFYSFHGLVKGIPLPPVYFVTPLVVGITMLMATMLIQYERLQGVRSSGVLFVFWFLCVLCALIPFRSKIIVATAQVRFRFTTFYLYFFLILVELVLSCFREQPPLFSSAKPSPNPCPEANAGFLSRLTFWWFTRMAILGYRRPLEEKDLWSLNEDDTSQVVVQRLLREWDRECGTLPFSQGSPGVHRKNMTFATKGNGAAGGDPKESEVLIVGRGRTQEPSFLRALLATFGPYFLISSFYKLLQDLLSFVNPQLLSVLIDFIKSPEAPAWQGFLIAGLMFACALLQTIILHQHFQFCFVTGMRLRTGITGVIYRKALLITNSAKRSSTLGEMVNLMSVDVQRFVDLVTFLNMLWSAPLQITLALFFLWQSLGPAVLAGVAVMVLLIPLNAVIAVKTRGLQVEQMQYKDSRIKLMNEILNGIKVLKLYAWEPSFTQQILGIRQKELRVLRKAACLSALSTFAWMTAPFLVALTTFAVYVSVDETNVLDAEKAFVSLSLFNILRFPLNMLPQVISNLTQTSVSLKRIQQFLNHDELDPDCVDTKTISPDLLPIFTFPPPHSIELWVPGGSLVAVVGAVGCGKSSLISALLGEMEKLEGQLAVKGSVAYVPQQAWIQHASLKDNILFGQPWTEQKYQHVLEACALTTDLAMLPAGDRTEIGEKGINLSGGQRQRVSLARAAYSNADTYLLDDPLSAVDSHVARHIFDQVIGPGGLLAGKTRLLVTHGVSFLPQVDHIIVLVDGRVSESGSYHALLQQDGAFAEFLRSHAPNDPVKEDEVSRKKPIELDTIPVPCGAHSLNPQFTEEVTETQRREMICPRSRSRQVAESGFIQSYLLSAYWVQSTVKLAVFLQYARAVGIWLSALVCFLYLGQNAASIGANIWLSDWTDEPVVNGSQSNTRLRVGVYASLGLLQGLLVMMSSLTLALGGIRAARTLHAQLLANKMRTPQAFYDTTPLGRIINRFSKDVYVIDEVIPPTVLMFLGTFFSSVSTVVIIMASTPLFAVVIVPLSILYFFVQRFYVATSRQLKRLESVSRSPIYSHFSETLTGTSIIRAFGRGPVFVAINDAKVDTNQRSYYPGITANRWLGIRVEFVGNCVVLFAALFAVIGRKSLNPGLVGLSVSYALQVTMSLNWMVRMTSDLESNIVAVERIKEYSETETEAPWVNEKSRPPADWPQKGEVEFVNYSVRYRKGLDLVLKGLSLRVKGGEKVGIVGRTGAGKSSMTLCLFRILEAAAGEIRIDGIKISDIGLHDLRSALTIIPQDPILFSGSLRMNVDPSGRYPEAEIWQALELSHLKKFVSSQPEGLEFECSEGGENLSVGQRQLVCLARALLRKSRILILDEATAAIDLDTDDLIQGTIRTQFAECTVLTIAHRLNTIMDYTRVLVLDAGQVAEFDTPAALLAAKGIFYGMARDAGLA
uniref:ATP binding cassette subfamily C member 3 n=1 Tax=Ornithorhynchus anatinus TaxID=9258 RepID=A0A6I8NPA0_ORNAN